MSVLRDLFGPGTWGTGGNLVAWVICGVAGGLTAFLLRNWIGPRLAGWWHRHHGEHLRGELAAMEARLKAHVEVTVADAQVNAGAGSNPAGQGLTAGERVVPPAATGRRSKRGGYTGGLPASEVGPPQDLPSASMRPKGGGRM